MKTRCVLALTLALIACEKEEAPTPDPAPSASAAAAAEAAPAAQPAAPSAGAHAHLPSDCAVLGHIDVAAILGHAAIKEHVVPALEELAKKPSDKGAGKGFAAFTEKSGIDPLKDVRAVAFCVRDLGENKPSFAAIVGGTFGQGKVLPALMSTSDQDLQETEIGGVKALTDPKGEKLVAQAKDGAIVFAGSKAMLEAALGTTSAASDAKLALDKALSLVVQGSAVQQAAAKDNNPFTPHLKKVQRVTSTSDLAKGAFETRITMPDNTAAAELGGFLKTVLAEMAQKPLRGFPPALAALTKSVEIEYDGADLVLQHNVPADTMAELAKLLGEALKNELR